MRDPLLEEWLADPGGVTVERIEECRGTLNPSVLWRVTRRNGDTIDVRIGNPQGGRFLHKQRATRK